MATAEEIANLRRLIAEAGPASPFDDPTLSARLDVADSIYALASEIWTEKAAAAAVLVDVTEGGSSRKMSGVQDQALMMASQMRNSATGSGVIVRRLQRP
jgi:hypothetical protein